MEDDCTPPLEIDGALDQRDEIATLLIELRRQRRAIQDDEDRAGAVLRNIMLARRPASFTIDGYTFALRPSREWWCATHSCPPSGCASHHGDAPVMVRRIDAEPYLSVRAPRPSNY